MVVDFSCKWWKIVKHNTLFVMDGWLILRLPKQHDTMSPLKSGYHALPPTNIWSLNSTAISTNNVGLLIIKPL